MHFEILDENFILCSIIMYYHKWYRILSIMWIEKALPWHWWSPQHIYVNNFPCKYIYIKKKQQCLRWMSLKWSLSPIYTLLLRYWMHHDYINYPYQWGIVNSVWDSIEGETKFLHIMYIEISAATSPIRPRMLCSVWHYSSKITIKA